MLRNNEREWFYMRLIIHGRHLDITPGIRLHAEKKINKIKKYFDNIMEVDVTLSAENLKTGDYHTADVLVYMNGNKIKASATDEDLYAAIDEVVDVLEQQITKYKEKLRDNKHSGGKRNTIKYNAETKTIEKEDVKKIIQTTVSARPMYVEEAVMQMEVLNKHFYVFMNPDTEELNVVYKRNDGDYGHVEPTWR